MSVAVGGSIGLKARLSYRYWWNLEMTGIHLQVNQLTTIWYPRPRIS
jgi:hypothetical protein